MSLRVVTKLFCHILLLTIISSCASSRVSGWFKKDTRVSMSKKEAKVLRSQALKHWSNRHNKEDLEKAIEAYKKLANSTQGGYEQLARLSRAYYFLADAHYSDIELKKKYWEIGTSYGEKAMATNEAFGEAMKNKDAKVEDHLGLLGKNEVSAMYWTASNLGKWAKNSGIATTLKYKTLIKKLISTVEKLQPSFFYYAPDRYWGAFYAIAPGFAGGDMKKSKKRFEKNMKQAPTYLGTKVLYADYYMVKKENKKKFKELLTAVVNSKVNDPNILSENIVEKRKAKKLLSEIDEKF